jgi:hypothetical protein
MSFVKDMLQVKALEREIGRALNPAELAKLDENESIELVSKRGRTFWATVKLYRFPQDVTTVPYNFREMSGLATSGVSDGE